MPNNGTKLAKYHTTTTTVTGRVHVYSTFSFCARFYCGLKNTNSSRSLHQVHLLLICLWEEADEFLPFTARAMIPVPCIGFLHLYTVLARCARLDVIYPVAIFVCRCILPHKVSLRCLVVQSNPHALCSKQVTVNTSSA